MRMRLRKKRRLVVLPSVIPRKASLLFILFILCLIGGFLFADHQLRPAIRARAEAHARVLATTSINQAIREKIAKNIRYEDLISVKVDNRGRVVLMQPNTGEINRLASDATITVQALMKNFKDTIYIPFGQLLGSQILAGRGPDIPIVIVPVGTVESRVYDLFEQAGINQTRHKISLEVRTTVRILVPLLGSQVEIKTEVPLTEAIIMGEVPQVYFGGQPIISLPEVLKTVPGEQ
ncbi:MAG TPA: sporulation protein YunB [Firmicutes bacterium]|jgi:sporulation protein YunB|nr:sporulation protein YunB [Bacillota bacterium]